MSVRLKLVVIVLFVALVPLAVSAFTALRIHRRAFDAGVETQQRNAAYFAAALAADAVDHTRRTIASVSQPIPWADLTEGERAGAVSLVYRQLDSIAIVQLLDETGEGIGSGVFLTERSRDPELAAHPVVTLDVLEAFSRSLPARAAGAAVGPVFATPAGEPMVAVTVPVDGPGGARWSVAAGVSLASLCASVRGSPADDLGIAVYDGDARAVCPDRGGAVLAPASEDVARALASGGERLVTVTGADGAAMVGAVAAGPLGWTVLAQRDRASATAPGRRMRNQTWFWIGVSVAVALAAGLFLAQGIIGPVRRLAAGADAIATGDFTQRLPATGRDELGDLARTFNRMSAEIQDWNRELTERVDERTRDLKQAQQQLLQSQKIAAVSSLAAGVAHEINNPLTGVLGLAQVLRAQDSGDDDARRDALATIETEAKRIRDIVQTLQSFSSDSSGEGLAELDVNAVVDGALELVASKLDVAMLTVERALAPDVPRIRGSDAQLRQALLHIIGNAIAASNPGGTIRFETRSIDGQAAKLIVRDAGRGISAENLARIYEPFFTTKHDWEGRGLGLTVAYRVIEEHHGSIEIDSEEGVGTSVEITLPASTKGSHLV
jgi:signal transduction histidine kinase